MPVVIEEMPMHFQKAEQAIAARVAKGGKAHAAESTIEELKSGAESRMAKIDLLPPEIRALVWDWGYISVINAGRNCYPRSKWSPVYWAAKTLLKHLKHAQNMRRIEDDKILGIHKGLDTGTVIDMF